MGSTAQKIKNYMKERGIIQSHLAREMKISESSLSMMLQGKRKINAEDYLAICNILGVSVDCFTE